MMMGKRSKKCGVALIEILSGLLIVAMAAMLASTLMAFASKTESMVSNYDRAVAITQRKIDQAHGIGYGRLTQTDLALAGVIDSTSTTQPYNFAATDKLNTIFPKATGTIEVTDFTSNIRRVSVTVKWTGSARKQGNGSFTLETLVAKS